jgi:hypothetical protein
MLFSFSSGFVFVRVGGLGSGETCGRDGEDDEIRFRSVQKTWVGLEESRVKSGWEFGGKR